MKNYRVRVYEIDKEMMNIEEDYYIKCDNIHDCFLLSVKKFDEIFCKAHVQDIVNFTDEKMQWRGFFEWYDGERAWGGNCFVPVNVIVEEVFESVDNLKMQESVLAVFVIASGFIFGVMALMWLFGQDYYQEILNMMGR